MKAKYLKKITVSARFQTQILSQEKFKGLSDEDNEELWRTYLNALAATRQISKHQAKTWKYPNEILQKIMSFRPRTSVEIKKFNIIKLMKQVKTGKMTLKEAEINRRLEKLRQESDVGAIWAEDLEKEYIEMVKNLNKSRQYTFVSIVVQDPRKTEKGPKKGLISLNQG